jgi:diguanylate cyclase (GGDEF)-like protein
MSPRETMAAFFATQLDFIFFFYGLAFVLLGVVCFAVARVPGRGNCWIALGLFALLHGAGEWLDLIALAVADSSIFAVARIVVMAGSFLLLLEFARQKAIRFGARPMGRYLYAIMILLVAIGGAVGGLSVAAALARYVIGFFAALAASLVFFAHASNFSGTTKRLALLAAAGFALYAVAAGAIVPPAPFWPANTFNYAWFLALTGIPIQLVRGLLACLLAFSVWAIWGQLLIAEVSSDRYTAHLGRQFVWTLVAMAAILVLGWTLTQFLGGIYKRNVEETAQGDINLMASRLAGETATVDGMVRALAGSPAVLPLLTGGTGQDERRARSVLDLDVESAGARLGAILDIFGNVVAVSDGIGVQDTANWASAGWFQKALGGQADHYLSFDLPTRRSFYYASYPVRDDGGAITGVAVLQKSLDGMEADLKTLARPYFFINPDGIVVQTNQPGMMLRPMWPLPAEGKSTISRQFPSLDDRPIAEREIEDASWMAFDGQRDFLRRSYVKYSQWSIVLATPGAKIFASRVLGIIITLLVTMMALIYFFGREHGIRDRIQLDRRLELQELARDLRRRATTDPLTGLHNRSKFDASLASEIARARRYNSPLALIMFDIDHFKQVNDVHGHQAGDAVLVRMAQLVAEHVRNTDLLARWGGEEFVLLAPGSDGATAHQTAAKLKTLVSGATFGAAGKITCSFGVAELSAGDSEETLVARADGALYRAKINGRDRVELASPPNSAASGEAAVA